MKIKPRTFQLMWDTHSVCGIFIGLALFVIFYTGAFTLFQNQIRVWEEPVLRSTAMTHEAARSVDDLVQPVLDEWGVEPSYLRMGMPGEDHAEFYLYAAHGKTPEVPDQAWINPATGAWADDVTGAGVSMRLYYLHFFYQMGRWGMYLAGLVGLFTLLAIVTGVVIHLHRLVKDFFQFRPRKKLRVAWADAHKVLGTSGLPFQLMYAFTGTFYCLLILVALPYTLLLYDGNVTQLYRDAGYYGPQVAVDSVAAEGRASYQEMRERAEAEWPGFEVETMYVHDAGAPNAYVEVVGRRHGDTFGGSGALVYHGVTGEELARRAPGEAGALNELVHVIEVLHFAEFGGALLRWLFFSLALASCAVILTGNLTWLEVRRGQDRRVNRILARLTAGVATGLVPATALLFVASRLLPEDLAGHRWWEGVALFGTWLLATLYALARRDVARTHRVLLVTGGVLALLIPLTDGLTTGAWPWVTWGAGQWAVFGVDLGALCCGLVVLGLAASLKVDADAPPPRVTPASARKPLRPQVLA